MDVIQSQRGEWHATQREHLVLQRPVLVRRERHRHFMFEYREVLQMVRRQNHQPNYVLCSPDVSISQRHHSGEENRNVPRPLRNL